MINMNFLFITGKKEHNRKISKKRKAYVVEVVKSK